MSQSESLKETTKWITQICPKLYHSKMSQIGSLFPNVSPLKDVKNWLLNGVPTTIFTFFKIDLVFSTIYLN